jgi:protein TonB
MLNTKLNLYNAEWLDVVFSDRNKAYGAYDLRQHYGQNMVKAMGIAFTTVIAAAIVYSFSTGHVDVIMPDTGLGDTTIVKLTRFEQERHIDPPKPAVSVNQRHVATTAFLPPVVTSDPVTTDPPRIGTLTGEVGPVTATGTGTVPQVVEPATTGGQGTAPVVDETIHTLGGLEFMPEPVGGAAAWSKFLNRNLRFPSQAQDAGKGGRVLVSFVIEKDGRLSNISVEAGAGYGMDEEAMRVLKLAKAWKPGMQNGQPVRVRYSIPINFQLSEQ